MTKPEEHSKLVEEVWRSYLNTGRPPHYVYIPWFMKPQARAVISRLPSHPRCHLCYAPFSGPGGMLMRLAFGLDRSRLNPQVCNVCDSFVQEYEGGAEVELSILFADVRNSTGLARDMSPSDFSRLINRFFRAATDVLFEHHGLVEKLIGDEVTGFFVPGMAGPNHARAALLAAQDILRATGHGGADPPWLSVGVGLHTGTAYVGSVGSDIVVLGDVPNTGAHLASHAGPGQVLVSDAAVRLAGWDTTSLRPTELQIKGRQQPFAAWTLTPES